MPHVTGFVPLLREKRRVLACTTILAAWFTTLSLSPTVAPAADKRSPAADKPETPVIIWMGSSSSGMVKNYMPRVLADRLQPVYKPSNVWFRADWISKDIEAGNQDKLAAIATKTQEAFRKAGKVDFGILQLSGGIISRAPDTDKHVPQILDVMCQAIRDSGAQPVIFEHWTSRDQPKLREYAIEAARRNGARVAFCGSALHAVAADKGGGKEGARYVGGLDEHTGPRGLYIATCCMYATLTGRSPVGLPAPAPNAKKVEIPKPQPGQLGGDGPATPEPDEPAAAPGKPRPPEEEITPEEAIYLQEHAWKVQREYAAAITATTAAGR